MEGPKFSGANEMDNEDLIPGAVTKATADRARRMSKEALLRSARKKTVAANDPNIAEGTSKDENEDQPSQPEPALPYLDRDDDELVPDPNNPGEMIMKKYLNS